MTSPYAPGSKWERVLALPWQGVWAYGPDYSVGRPVLIGTVWRRAFRAGGTYQYWIGSMQLAWLPNDAGELPK
jgi:hypothetical protein